MNTFKHQLNASVSRERLNLRPVQELHEHLQAEGFGGKRYVTSALSSEAMAFALSTNRISGPTLQLGKGDGHRGEIEIPYEALCEDAKRLYELLDGSGRSYPLTVNVYGSKVLHIRWPDKECARVSRLSPERRDD